MSAIASVYIDEAVLNKHLRPSIPSNILERYFILGTKPSNIARIYNRVLEETNERCVIFAHPDVEFSLEACETMEKALTGKTAVVGLVGVKAPGKYVDGSTISVTEEVATLDSCVFAINRNHRIRFDDKTFDELHLYGEDYCCAARAVGFRCVVVPVKHFFHASTTLQQKGCAWGLYRMYRQRLNKKWVRILGRMVATT